MREHQEKSYTLSHISKHVETGTLQLLASVGVSCVVENRLMRGQEDLLVLCATIPSNQVGEGMQTNFKVTDT